ncbi:MAG TPA: hypothetical protein VMF69_07000 [Gemmataceae bacterium]|nr:hypothetical protein [Gemmataceae bacterium]
MRLDLLCQCLKRIGALGGILGDGFYEVNRLTQHLARRPDG